MPTPRCRRCLDGVPHEFKHGLSGWKNHNCHCAVCADEMRRDSRERQRRLYVERGGRATCRRCAAGVSHEFKHGTTNGYSYHLCRCRHCTDAAVGATTRFQQRQKVERPDEFRRWQKKCSKCQRCLKGVAHDFQHGTQSGYTRHGCRCDRCTTWRRVNARQNPPDPDKKSAGDAAYYAANQDRIKQRVAGWQADNPNRVSQYRARRARIEGRINGPNNTAPWTSEQDAILFRPDLTLIEKSYLIGRTPSALRNRRNRLRKEQAA